MVARGTAYGDIDHDGDLDVLVSTNNGPARLFRNDNSEPNNVLRIQAIGTSSNRDGIGARVEVAVRGGARLWQMVKTGSSYASQSELPLTFGLGQASKVEQVEIRWPSGQVDRLGPQDAGQTLIVTEAKGVTAKVPFGK